MKIIRHILFVFLTIIAVSCSKADPEVTGPNVPKPSGPYIFFEPELLDVKETKADLINEFPTAEGTAFGVIGFYEDGEAIFDGYTNKIAKVYRDNNGVYKYDNLSPWMGEKHTFHAFYPYDGLQIGSGTDKVPYIVYTQPDAAAGMIDILGVRMETEKVAAVNLQFEHLLWAFNVVITNSQTTELVGDQTIENPSITIKNVTLTLSDLSKEVSLKLDAEYKYSTTSAYTSPVSYTVYSNATGEEVTTGSANAKSFGPLLFAPCAGMKYRITIDYVTQGGAEDTFVYPSATTFKSLTTSFARATVYNLNIEKNNDKFFVARVTTSDWSSVEFDHTFN